MKQRILFVTPDYSFFTQPVTKSLKKLGFNVKTFDYYKPNAFVRLTGFAGNHSLLPQSFAKKKVNTLINQALLKTISSFKPNYLLVIKGETIAPQTIKTIAAKGVITVNWYSDWFGSWNWIVNNSSSYSFFINTCLESHKRLKQANITNYYLPFASPIFNSVKKLKKIYKVTFVGQHTARREKFFAAIKDLGLKIWGYQWQDSSLKDVDGGPVPVATAHQIIRQSQIVVNPIIDYKDQQPNQVNVRTFETTGMGTFLLTQHLPLLKRYFTPGKEVVSFTNPQDLRRKVKYYLHHNIERRKIAQAGYRRAKKDHSFEIRLKQLFSLTQS